MISLGCAGWKPPFLTGSYGCCACRRMAYDWGTSSLACQAGGKAIAKAYGFQRGDAVDRGDNSETDDQPLELRDVSLVADALRCIASFINQCANLIDQHGNTFNHKHFCDSVPGWKQGDTDIIVVRQGAK